MTVHRCILAARSGFFRALLDGGMGDARQGELTLKVRFFATLTVGFVLYSAEVRFVRYSQGCTYCFFECLFVYLKVTSFLFVKVREKARDMLLPSGQAERGKAVACHCDIAMRVLYTIMLFHQS